jgi:hypothetical protein
MYPALVLPLSLTPDTQEHVFERGDEHSIAMSNQMIAIKKQWFVTVIGGANLVFAQYKKRIPNK